MNSLLPKVLCQSYFAIYMPMGYEIRIPVAHYCSPYNFFNQGTYNLSTLKQSSRGLMFLITEQ